MTNSLRKLWLASPPLVTVGLLMAGAFVVALLGLLVDPRFVSGSPAWLKPAKFGISTAIYSFTLAWYFTHLPSWTRLKRITGWITAVILGVEVGIIDVQAARGVGSHFNVAKPLDAVLFAIMGIAIVIAWMASVAVLGAVFRQRFDDRALAWSLRFGMLLTVLGTGFGASMVTPTRAQLAQARLSHSQPVSGAHTVGAPDGGPGLPGTGWSTQHGDLRVPHFFGMHAMQIVPVAGWFFGRRRQPVRRVWIFAISYVCLFGILIWQASRGLSIATGDDTTLLALGLWAIGSALAFIWTLFPRRVPQSYLVSKPINR